LAIAVISAGIGVVLDQNVGVETNIETFIPQDTPELLDIMESRDILGTTEKLSITFSDADIFTQKNITWITDITNNLKTEFPEQVVGVKSITTMLSLISPAPLTPEIVNQLLANLPNEQIKMLVNESETTGVIIVSIADLEPKDKAAFIDDLGAHLAASGTNTDVTVTGQAVIDVEMITALTTGRYTITLVGMLLVFIGLLVIYRNPFKALIPLITISLIVGWSGRIYVCFRLRVYAYNGDARCIDNRHRYRVYNFGYGKIL